MIRNLGSVVLGVVVWQVAMVASFTLMWLALGADRSFQPGIWEVTALWIGFALVAYAAAGVAGGLACARVARADWARALLCVLVLAGSVWQAVMGGAGTGMRPEDVGMQEAAANAVYPAWAAWLNAVLGPLAVLYGASKARRPGEAES